MAQFRTGASAATDLADTDHIIEKAKQHWRKLVDVGAFEAELKELERNAQAAHKIVEIGQQPPERSLEMVREEFRDLLGQMRRAGAVVADGFGGRDAAAEKHLGLNVPFPETDKQMKAHLGIVETGMRRYSDKLARRGFSARRSSGSSWRRRSSTGSCSPSAARSAARPARCARTATPSSKSSARRRATSAGSDGWRSPTALPRGLRPRQAAGTRVQEGRAAAPASAGRGGR